MAIKPYQRSVGLPDAPSPSGRVGTQIADIGGAITGLGDQLLRTAEPHIKARREKEAAEDFAKEGLGRDENGNLVVPETPDAGIYYSQAYDAAKFQQYYVEAFHEHESRLTELYSDPDNVGKKPHELRAIANGYLQGAVEAAPEELKRQLFEGLSREVRERDRTFSANWQRQEIALTAESLETSIKDNTTKAIDAYALGTPEAVEKAAGYADLIRANAQRLVDLRVVPPEYLDRIETVLVSARGAGTILAKVRATDDATSLELAQLAGLLQGNMDEPVFGLTLQEVSELIPSQDMRDELARRIGPVETLKRREEAEAARRAEMEEFVEPNGIGKGFGVSDQEYAEGVLAWSQANNIDPTSVQGMVRVHQAWGELPKKLYESVFRQLPTKDGSYLERVRPLYEAMDQLIDANGQKVNATGYVMAAEDEAFMFHFSEARQGGMDVAQSVEAARAATEAGLKMGLDEQVSWMIERVGGKRKQAELFDKLDDGLSVSFEALGQDAQNFLTTMAAQRMAMGMGFDKAAESAIGAFRNEFVLSEYDLSAGMGGEGRSYVRRGTAELRIADVMGGDGKTTTEWYHAYMPVIRDQVGDMPAGIDPAKLQFKKNVWLRSAGPAGKDGSRLFNLIYYDPQLKNPPIPLKGKDGNALVVDFGKAARSQHEFAKALKRKRASDGEGGFFDNLGRDIRSNLQEWFDPQLDPMGLFEKGDKPVDMRNRRRQIKKPEWGDIRVSKVKRETLAGRSANQSEGSDYLARLWQAESSSGKNLKAPKGSASGHYQWLDETWLINYREVYPNTKRSSAEILALRGNKTIEDKVITHFTEKNRRAIAPYMPISDVTLYAAHHFGAKGAIKLWNAWKRAPRMAISSVLGSLVEKNNPKLAGRTIDFLWRSYLPIRIGG